MKENKVFVGSNIYTDVALFKNVLMKFPEIGDKYSMVLEHPLAIRDPDDPERKGIIVQISQHLKVEEYVDETFVFQNYFFGKNKPPYGKFITANVSIKKKEDWSWSWNNLRHGLIIDIFLVDEKNPQYNMEIGTAEGQIPISDTKKYIRFKKIIN